MAKNGKTFIIAIVCILVSAAAAIYFVFSWLKPVNIIVTGQTSLIPSITQTPLETIIPKPTETATDDLQSALKTLKSFNEYLNYGEYAQAAALFDWEGQGDLKTIFGQYYAPGDNSKTLSNVCKDKNFCLRFYKILRSKKEKGDEYSFIVQFQTKDGKIFVNSAHVSGTFVTNTDFLYTVKKINGKFKVTSPPNFFTVEAD